MNTGCFKKGQTPWNKGMKGLTIGNVATQFKPGDLPHNTKPIGFISLRLDRRSNYYTYYIKLDHKKWMPLNRYIWQQHNGPIPKSSQIRFRNGNPFDCTIGNLELVSRRESIARNTNNFNSDAYVAARLTHNEPELRRELIRNHPDIINLKRLNDQLKREVKHANRGTIDRNGQ